MIGPATGGTGHEMATCGGSRDRPKINPSMNSCTTFKRRRRFHGPSFPIASGCTTAAARCGSSNTRAPSELHEPFFSKPMDLLSKVDGIQFVKPSRPDECCGFGGTFSVFEEVVSTKMGYDKVTDHARAGAEYIVSADSSCLMHQQGCAERIGVPLKFIHIAQILNGASA